MNRQFVSVGEEETHDKTASCLENNGYLDRETAWAAFAAVVDHARWMGMSDDDVRAAFEKSMYGDLTRPEDE